jgi:glyoxylase-like metal-dependent hydrolase (beta-lactamase superfamily II)
MTTPLPFVRELEIEYGVAATVSPLIRRVVARNPSAFTFKGTGTYIVGRGTVAVIDPGPLLEAHVAALVAALAGETVSHILVTHTHIDHSPAAAPLKAATGARTFGHGPHGSGDRRRVDGAAALDPALQGPFEEGADPAFAPDVTMREGDTAAGPGWHLEAMETPGHTSNHLAFHLVEEDAVFTGDHIMGWSTTAIGPPDGDMAQYKASLRRFVPGGDGRAFATFWPTHGPPVRDTVPLVQAYLRHRAEREALILRALSRGADTVPEIVRRVYLGLDPRLVGAAGRSTLAHLLELMERGEVAAEAQRYRLRH